MIRHACLAAAFAIALAATPAAAACRIAGDCIAMGLGGVLRGCTTDAKVGISAAAVVARVPAGSGPLVVSAGSNDFPRSLPAARYARARASVETSLAAIQAKAGAGGLVLVLPANGARAIVARWATAHGVRTVSFTAGRDGIHPKSYGALGRAVLAVIGQSGS